MMHRFVFILALSLSLALCAAGDANLGADIPNHAVASSSQRRELSFWSNIFDALHPLKKHGQSSSSSSGSTTGSNTSGTADSNTDGTTDGTTDEVSATTSTTEEVTSYLENDGAADNSMGNSGSSGTSWLIGMVAAVAAAVGVAFAVNKKKLQCRNSAKPLVSEFVEITSVQVGNYTAPQVATAV